MPLSVAVTVTVATPVRPGQAPRFRSDCVRRLLQTDAKCTSRSLELKIDVSMFCAVSQSSQKQHRKELHWDNPHFWRKRPCRRPCLGASLLGRAPGAPVDGPLPAPGRLGFSSLLPFKTVSFLVYLVSPARPLACLLGARPPGAESPTAPRGAGSRHGDSHAP